MEKKAVSPIQGIAYRPWRGDQTLEQKQRAGEPQNHDEGITPQCAFCGAQGEPGSLKAGRAWFSAHECWSSR